MFLSIESVFVSFVRLVFEGRWVHQTADLFAKEIHDEYGAYHTSVTEGSPAIKSCEARLAPNSLGGVDKVPIGLALDVPLHAGLDGVEGMRHVATKQTAQECGRDPCLVVRVKYRRVVVHEAPADDRGDAQIPAGPQGLSYRHAKESPREIDRVLGDFGNPSGPATALPLLLDHDELEGGSHQRRQGPSDYPTGHFFLECELVRIVASRDDVFEFSTNHELDHRTGSHVDAIGNNTTVHVNWIHRNRSLLLDHIFGVIEGLQDQNLNHTDRHTDGRILLLVQLSRHTGQACKNI